jgi:hypothetical protein
MEMLATFRRSKYNLDKEVIMNTDYLFVNFILIFYMAVNVWTDLRNLETKNIWHIIIAITIFSYGSVIYGIGITIRLLIALGLNLCLSLLHKLPKTSFGSGDIKMLMVVSVISSLLIPDKHVIYVVLLVHCLYFLVSFIILTICKIIQIRMKKKEVAFFSYRITKDYIVTPEALPLFITSILLIIL